MTHRKRPRSSTAAWSPRDQLEESEETTGGLHDGVGCGPSSRRSRLDDGLDRRSATDQPEDAREESTEDLYRFRSIRVPLSVLRKWLFVRLPSVSSDALWDTQPPHANRADMGWRLDTGVENHGGSVSGGSSLMGEFRWWHVALWFALGMGMALLIGAALFIGLPRDGAKGAFPNSLASSPGNADWVTPVGAREPGSPPGSSAPVAKGAPEPPRSAAPVSVFPSPPSRTTQPWVRARERGTRAIFTRKDQAKERGSGVQQPSGGSKEDAASTEVWTTLHDPPED